MRLLTLYLLERLMAMMELILTVERSPVKRQIPPLKVNILSPAVQAIISRLYKQTAFCQGIQVTGEPDISNRKISGVISVTFTYQVCACIVQCKLLRFK